MPVIEEKGKLLLQLGGNRVSAFIYNPYHYVVLYGLQSNGINVDSLVLSKRLSQSIKTLPAIQSRRVVVLRDGYTSDGLLSRILSFPINLALFLSVSGRYPLLTANDRSLHASIWARLGINRKLPVIDEGALSQILHREQKNKAYRMGIIDIICGRYPRLCNPRTNVVLTEDPDLTNPSSSTRVGNIQWLVKGALTEIANESLESTGDFKSCILLVSSPLTENGNVGSLSETALIERLLCANPTRCFYWSRHYREAKTKYDRLFEEYSNFKKLPSVWESLPGQLYAPLFHSLIGFHSSLLVHHARKACPTYSLSSLVDSRHAQAFVRSAPQGLKFMDSDVKLPAQ